MVQLSGADQQQAAQKVVVIVERIAKERGISEEEAYKMFLKYMMRWADIELVIKI